MSALLTKIDDKNIATVTLNRPLIHNAIDDQLARIISAAGVYYRSVIIRGTKESEVWRE